MLNLVGLAGFEGRKIDELSSIVVDRRFQGGENVLTCFDTIFFWSLLGGTADGNRLLVTLS